MAGASDNGIHLRLPGQWDDGTWDDATSGAGVNYNVHRWYAPSLGRYSGPDPEWRPIRLLEVDPYLYVGANPLLYIDALGLERLRVCCNHWDKMNIPRILKRAAELQSAAITDSPAGPKPGPSRFGKTGCNGQRAGVPGRTATIYWNTGHGPCADACVRAHEQAHRDLCKNRQGFEQRMQWKRGTEEALALLEELECLQQALLKGMVDVQVDPLGPNNKMTTGFPP